MSIDRSGAGKPLGGDGSPQRAAIDALILASSSTE